MASPNEQLAAAHSTVARDRLRNTIPTAEELKAYADRLPPIYREVLAAFQQADPNRMKGDPVAFGTLRSTLLNEAKEYTDPELELAIGKLVDMGFLDESDFPEWFTPTPIGDALIAIITGKPVRPVSIPELPTPTWVG